MPRPTSDPSSRALLSIGSLSASTGIPVDTIRTWERRYGFPQAERKPSGHRVYAVSAVPRLRRVAQAIAQGHRAAHILTASDEELDALLAAGLLEAAARPVDRFEPTKSSGGTEFEPALDDLRRFDGESLKRRWHEEWSRMGPLEFMERRASPFLVAVGQAWAEGSISVRHEHFASGLLGDFLRSARQPLEHKTEGPVAALATLPGELHGLGLQMTALVFALASWQTLILGVDTPSAQIAALAREAPLSVVAISCVQRAGASAAIKALRRQLPRRIPLLVGGTGAPETIKERGVTVLPTLRSLESWLRGRTFKHPMETTR